MFGLFRKSVAKPELPESAVLYLQNQFAWLYKQFGASLLQKEILVPDATCFPIVFDGTEAPVWKAMEIAAKQIDIDPKSIHLDFFTEFPSKINAGVTNYYIIGSKGSTYANGLYWGKAEDNKYHIWLRNDLLKNPEGIVATLAHELAHVRLLGEKILHPKYDRDHELLTEMLCVFSGFGIFRSTQAYQIRQGFDGWSYSFSGYLRQQSWGFLLALYASARREEKPVWQKFLSPSIKKDFSISLAWLTQQNFVLTDRTWKNHTSLFNEPIMNISGQWEKQSTYGAFYKEDAGKKLFTRLQLSDNEGELSGEGEDVSGHGMQSVPVVISGTIRNNAVKFELTYIFPDKTNDSGVVIRKAEKKSYAVSYTGFYSDFLDAITGEWVIRTNDPERGELISGSGTFEMKRLK
jgi:hypothetical protein